MNQDRRPYDIEALRTTKPGSFVDISTDRGQTERVRVSKALERAWGRGNYSVRLTESGFRAHRLQ